MPTALRPRPPPGQGLHAGVKLRDDDWQPLYDAPDARDWIFAIEALAFGEHDPEFAEWIDDAEKRASLVDELPVAAVLIYRFWRDSRAYDGHGRRSHAARHDGRCCAQGAPAPALKSRVRLDFPPHTISALGDCYGKSSLTLLF